MALNAQILKRESARTVFGVLILLIWLSGCQHPQVSTSKETAEGLRFANALADRASAELRSNPAKAKESWLKAKLAYQEALKLAPRNADVLFSYAATLSDEAEALVESSPSEAHALWAQAEGYYARSLQADPRYYRAANSWGLSLAAQAKFLAKTDMPRARRLWREAGLKYMLALQILPSNHGAANNWGNALCDEADATALSDFAAATGLWRQARQKYQWSLTIKPDKYNAMSNWGLSCGSEAEALAKAGRWESALAMWQSAAEKFEQALSIAPDFGDALSGYGNLLGIKSRLLQERAPKEAQVLRQRAIELCGRALLVDSGDVVTMVNLAIYLELEGKSYSAGQIAEALSLLEQSMKLYRRTISIRPNYAVAYTGLGNCLDAKARLLAASGQLPAARSLWREAASAYAQSVKVEPTILAVENQVRALRAEAEYVKVSSPMESRGLLENAHILLTSAMTLFPEAEILPLLSGYCYSDEYTLTSTGANLTEQSKILHLALQRYATAARLKPSSAEVWEAWGVALLQEGHLLREHDTVRVQELFFEAANKMMEACRLDPLRYSAKYNLARIYNAIAKANDSMDRGLALEYFRRAEVECARATVLGPVAAEPQLLLAEVLCSQAVLQAHVNSLATLELCRRADEIFHIIEGLNVVAGQQTWKLARALANQAEALAGYDLPRALRVFDDAALKFGITQTALPNQALVLLNWGQLLQAKAQSIRLTDLPAARLAWAQARDKYAAKKMLEPNVPDAFIEIGLTFLREYAALPVVDRAGNRALLDEAEKPLLAAEAIAHGSGGYNLACLAALRNQPKECVIWLESIRQIGRLPRKDILLGDGYLRLVANTEEFKLWIATAFTAQ